MNTKLIEIWKPISNFEGLYEVSNLEWCDRQYNIKHAYKMGLNPSKKKMIEYINSLEERIKKLEKIIKNIEYKVED